MERLPKGFGTVTKLSGNRRKPYCAKVFIERDFDIVAETANPIYKIVGYAKSRKDAILMLENYHKNPYDTTNVYTFSQVYTLMVEEYVDHRSYSSQIAYNASYLALKPLHNMKFKDIKTIDIQKAFDKSKKNYPTIRKMKVLLNQVYKYALKYDVCTKDYSKLFSIDKYKNVNPKARNIDRFSNEQIKMLWDFKDDRYYQIILILINTGVRIGELLELKKDNVHLEKQYFEIVSSKTESGIRKVPIANHMIPIFENWLQYSKADTLLCTPDHKPLTYRNYYDSYWKPLLEPLNIKYTPHSTRHTFISNLAELNTNPTITKLIVGHSGAMSLTERTYTHLNIQLLIDAVNNLYNH